MPIQRVLQNNIIKSAHIAANAVGSSELDLTANYAFTGSVSGVGGFTLATPQSPTSGASIDFTGLPADISVIFVTYAAVDMSGANWLTIQLGDSGGFETTEYTSAVDYPGSGNSFYANTAQENNGLKLMYQTSTPFSGIAEIVRQSANQTTWVMKARSHAVGDSVSYSTYSAVEKTLSGALTQIRLINAGSHTFSAGTINIAYQ